MRNLIFVLIVGTVCAPAHSSIDDEKLHETRAYLRVSEKLATSGQIRYETIKDIKEAGFEVIVNLAPADKVRNAMEGFLVTEQGMTYVQIPVSWQNPSQRDLELFFDVMEANKDRNVYVHCFANMRVSVFVYLYRVLQLGVQEQTARADLEKIWDPSTQAQWARFIEQARTNR